MKCPKCGSEMHLLATTSWGDARWRCDECEKEYVCGYSEKVKL